MTTIRNGVIIPDIGDPAPWGVTPYPLAPPFAPLVNPFDCRQYGHFTPDRRPLLERLEEKRAAFVKNVEAAQADLSSINTAIQRLKDTPEVAETIEALRKANVL